MEKTILHIYTDSPSFSKQELKLKLTTKISKTEKLLQFKLFQEKWTHNTFYKSDLCGGLQLVPSLTSLTQLLGNLLSVMISDHIWAN